MFLVGLTGGIATGKSTVSQMLTEAGCVIIDADLIARQVVRQGSVGWSQVREVFGEDICTADGNIDRAKLGGIIFSDSNQRRKLNAITHPLIRKEMLWQAMKALFQGRRYVVLDTPLLAENKGLYTKLCSEIVVVHCDEQTQLTRLMERNQLSDAEARQRILSQIPIERKKALATNSRCLIDNNSDIETTAAQVRQLKAYLDNSWRPELFRIIMLVIALSLGKVILSYCI